MIAVTPKADKETVVEELNQFFKEHVSTEKKFTDAVLDHFGKNLMWEIFSNHGIDVAINDDGIVQFRALTRMGFTQLYDAYLLAKYGLTLDSLVTHDRDTGALKTPMSSIGIDRAIEKILAQANARWITNKAVTPTDIGDIIYDILEREDGGVLVGLNERLENEAKAKTTVIRKSWVKRFREHWHV